MLRPIALVAGLYLVCAVHIVQAADKAAPATKAPAASSSDQLPKPIQTLIDAGYAISKRFDAGHGLTGWVLTRATHSTVVFTTSDQQVIISGAVVDASGQNLTQTFLTQYAPKPDLRPIYDELAKTSYISEHPADPAKRIVYILFDPNCPFCSDSWKALRSLVATTVEVRWVPVAYLQANSTGRVAAILSAKDPVAALATNEEGFHADTHQGGIEPATTLPDSVSKALRTDDDLMTRLGSNATPTFVWLDAHNEVQTYVGLPSQLKMLEIVGVAAPGAAGGQ
jgi:thiol:disulfide interchange protein DsbG